MGFWSGFEGLTGHRPGAFKGFSLKDILDKDMWERRERLGGRQSRQFEQTGVVPTTNWYRGRGKVMGPKVGAVETEVRENRLMDERPDMFAGVNQRAFDAATLANQQRRNALWGSGPATVSAARPWANIQSRMLSDPRQGVESMRIPPAELMGDKKTVREIFADPTKSDKITETVTQKVPVGDMRIPTSELMGGGQRVPTGSAQWGNVQHPPNWQQRFSPASIMNMRIPTSELVGGRDEDRIREMMRVLEGMRARRGY